jgi:hypothetical protein
LLSRYNFPSRVEGEGQRERRGPSMAAPIGTPRSRPNTAAHTDSLWPRCDPLRLRQGRGGSNWSLGREPRLSLAFRGGRRSFRCGPIRRRFHSRSVQRRDECFVKGSRVGAIGRALTRCGFMASARNHRVQARERAGARSRAGRATWAPDTGERSVGGVRDPMSRDVSQCLHGGRSVRISPIIGEDAVTRDQQVGFEINRHIVPGCAVCASRRSLGRQSLRGPAHATAERSTTRPAARNSA